MKKKFALLVALALCGIFFYACGDVREVVLSDGAGIAKYAFVPPDGRFAVRFLHSWARSPVDEFFELSSNDLIVLTGTSYEDFGAGLPHEPEPGGGGMRMQDGKIRLDLNRPVPNLQIRVGRFVANHELFYGDVKIPLSRIVPPGNAVTFGVRRIKRYTLWLREAGLQ